MPKHIYTFIPLFFDDILLIPKNQVLDSKLAVLLGKSRYPISRKTRALILKDLMREKVSKSPSRYSRLNYKVGT